MKHVPSFAGWGAVAIALLFSPIVLIFGVPFLCGIGLDIFDRWGETPFVAALCAPFLLLMLWHAPWARVAAFWRTRPQPAHSGKLHYAP